MEIMQILIYILREMLFKMHCTKRNSISHQGTFFWFLQTLTCNVLGLNL